MEEKPPPPGEKEKVQRLEAERASRRTFLMNVGIALNTVVAAMIATPVVAYLLGPVLKRKDYLEWIEIGSATDFPRGMTKLVTYRNPFTDPWDGATASVPAYVRCASDGSLTVFAINCAHLGCPVRWFAESQLFMCPCHGGVYYADGSRASGPPERGLFTYPMKVEGGKLMIRAGQMPTLQNNASLGPCPGVQGGGNPAIVATIGPVRTEHVEPRA
jgi:Rieske Fe-S protein